MHYNNKFFLVFVINRTQQKFASNQTVYEVKSNKIFHFDAEIFADRFMYENMKNENQATLKTKLAALEKELNTIRSNGSKKKSKNKKIFWFKFTKLLFSLIILY
jgi:hypothetical protein